MIRRLLALVNLGCRATLHYLAMPFRNSVTAERRFVETFLPDHLVPTTASTRDLMVGASRCTGCGLCDARCALEALLPPGHPGPSWIPLALTRAVPDLHDARGDLGLYRDCGGCRACEAWCPEDVPLKALLDDATAVLDRLDRRRAGVVQRPRG